MKEMENKFFVVRQGQVRNLTFLGWHTTLGTGEQIVC